MGEFCLRNCGALVRVLLVAGMTIVGSARAQTADELYALGKQVQQLYQAGKYEQALPIAERYVAATKARLGENGTE
jgi:hypothetical protein